MLHAFDSWQPGCLHSIHNHACVSDRAEARSLQLTPLHAANSDGLALDVCDAPGNHLMLASLMLLLPNSLTMCYK